MCRSESCFVTSIPALVENKQLPPPTDTTAFGVPVFEAHKGKLQVLEHV